MASARARASSEGARRMKYARRCAVFGPIPGSLPSSSMSRASGRASADAIPYAYVRPGMSRPPVRPPRRCAASSLLLRVASAIAARTRSCSISTSSAFTTPGSIRTLFTSWAPVITTATAPPPAVPSTVATASSACACCMRACISRASRWISPRFFTDSLYFQDAVGAAEDLVRRAQHRILGRGLRLSEHAADAHARSDELLEVPLQLHAHRVARHLGPRELVRKGKHERATLDADRP